MRKDWLKCVALLLPVLTGCLSHTRKLQRPILAGPVLNADVVQLVKGINDRYAQINSLTATVEFAVSVGGAHKGKQTDYTTISGYILVRKPQMLRVLGIVPVVHTHAFDLASNGTDFKLLIPPRNRAIEGSNSVSTHSSNPLENLRPAVFLDSLLIYSIEPDRIVSLTNESLTVPGQNARQLIEQPDYDLAVLSASAPAGSPPLIQYAKPLRVIRISRINLLPVGQDIYDANGDLETQVTYSAYQNFGGIQFPATIVINRPLEEYRMTVTIVKLLVNPTLTDNQFELKIPEGVKVETLQ